MHCASYAVRRLNPFLGVTQVLACRAARALSIDGEHWELQVQAAQPEHSWRAANRFEPVLRYFRFGVWSAANGLRQVPLSPILDIGEIQQALAPLLEALPQRHAEAPFPLSDAYELWSLDSAGQPLALLASTPDAEQMASIKTAPWNAAPLREQGFRPNADAPSGGMAYVNPRQELQRLEKLIRDNAGRPARLQWFWRQADGAALVCPMGGEPPQPSSPPCPAAGFPPFSVRDRWDDAEQDALLRDYIDWIAPYLLTLPTLSRSQRDRLEQAARQRATLVAKLYRLYPRVNHPEWITAARVEARLRETSEA